MTSSSSNFIETILLKGDAGGDWDIGGDLLGASTEEIEKAEHFLEDDRDDAETETLPL